MKLTSKISRMAQVLIVSCCLASCNYLDVIPPAQADFDDTMKDEETTLGFCIPVMPACLARIRSILSLLNRQPMRKYFHPNMCIGRSWWHGEQFLLQVTMKTGQT